MAFIVGAQPSPVNSGAKSNKRRATEASFIHRSVKAHSLLSRKVANGTPIDDCGNGVPVMAVSGLWNEAGDHVHMHPVWGLWASDSSQLALVVGFTNNLYSASSTFEYLGLHFFRRVGSGR
jgi:hypothetical protein